MNHAARKLAAALLVGVVMAIGAWTPASATTMVQRSTEQLTVEADYVVEGVVSAIESRVHEDHQFVYTYVTIDIEQRYKGRTADRVEVEVLGGVVGSLRVTVPATPQFEIGERVVVFLQMNPSDQIRVYGMAQGKFSVQTDPSTGERIAVRPMDIEATYGRTPGGELDSTIDAATGLRSYDTLIETIAAWADRIVAPGGE